MIYTTSITTSYSNNFKMIKILLILHNLSISENYKILKLNLSFRKIKNNFLLWSIVFEMKYIKITMNRGEYEKISNEEI